MYSARRSSGLPGSITCAQLSLRFASRITSMSPLIHTSAFLARTGSAPSETWPVVVMIFGLAGNSSGMRGSSLAPAVTENVTSGLLASAAVLNRSALSLWHSSNEPLRIIRADEIHRERARHQIGQRRAEQVEVAAAQRDRGVRESDFLPLDLDLDFLRQLLDDILVDAVSSPVLASL